MFRTDLYADLVVRAGPLCDRHSARWPSVVLRPVDTAGHDVDVFRAKIDEFNSKFGNVRKSEVFGLVKRPVRNNNSTHTILVPLQLPHDFWRDEELLSAGDLFVCQ